MGEVLVYRLRAELRERWRTLLGLVLLVAALGGIVLAAAAGARRTSSAYDRFLDVANPPELIVSPPGGPGSDTSVFYDALARLDGVRATSLFAGLPVLPAAATPSERLAEAFTGIGVVAALDSTMWTEIGRPRVTGGRLPRPDRAHEVMISHRFATRADLAVGDHIDVVLPTDDQTGGDEAAPANASRSIRLTITGIGVVFDEVVPFSDLNEEGSILATAPLAALVDRTQWYFEGAAVDTAPGADVAAITSAIERLAVQDPGGTGGAIFVSDQASSARQVSDAMRPLAVAIAVAAAAVAFVALFVVGQAMARTSREPPGETDALRALGTRTSDRLAFTAARGGLVGVGGAIGALVLAVALSGRFPIGIARIAEPSPGVRVDTAVLVIGAVAIVAVAVASSVPAALHRPRAHLTRPSRLAAAAAARGLSPAAVQGARFAARGGTRTVPMRSTVLAVTIAVTAALATVTFADSLGKLIDTPRRYGQGWDRLIDAEFAPAPVRRIVERFDGDPLVRGIAAGNYGDVTVNGVPVPAFDLVSVKGQVSVVIDAGRPAQNADEIVLGGETIDRLDVRVGDLVQVDTGEGPRPMRLTGSGVFPRMGQGSFSTTGLGIGAQLGGASLASFGDLDNVPPGYELDGRLYNFVAVDLAAAPSARDHEFAELEAATVADEAFALTRREQPPTKIRDLDRVRVVPRVTAAVLALAGVAALAHLLITSVRERRRELALLQTLGFSRRQLQATVGWQASIVALAALVIGAPLGILLGRTIWKRFADGLYTTAAAETPWIWLGAVLVGSVIVANLVAAPAGRAAARTHPAVVLRDE